MRGGKGGLHPAHLGGAGAPAAASAGEPQDGRPDIFRRGAGAPRRGAGRRLFWGDARAGFLSDRFAFSVGEGVERLQLLLSDAICTVGAHRVRGRAGGEPALSAGRLALLSRLGAGAAAPLLRTLAARDAGAALRRGSPDGGRGRAGRAAGLRLRPAPAG